MRLLSLLRAGVTASIWASAAASLLPRQLSGAVEKKNYMRRAFHSTVILDGWLYIDGEDFSYLTSSGDIRYDYSNSLLGIDLSRGFSDGDTTITIIEKPNGVASLLHGGLWVDEKERLLYVGLAGVQSEFGDRAPQPYGLWSFSPASSGGGPGTWTNLNDTAPAFKTQPRPFFGQAAYGDGKGYYLGGVTGDNRSSTANQAVSGLLVYDFSTKALALETATNSKSKGIRQVGGLHFVPHFGTKGILIAMGGQQFQAPLYTLPPTDNMFPLTTIEVFDIASGKWYEQQTTGGPPTRRREFCLSGAASAQKTYELLFYGGWGGFLGSDAIPQDDAWVLTLPGFRWVKADYPPIAPRHAHTCNHARGGQVIVVGGADSTQKTYETGYAPDKQVYNSHALVQSFYAKNPNSVITIPELAAVFEVRNFESIPNNFTNTTTGADSPISTTDSAKPSANVEKANYTAEIAGGALGGLAGLCLIALGCWLYVRCWKRKHLRRSGLEPAASEMCSGQKPRKPPVEMNGDYAREMPAPVVYEMWAGSGGGPEQAVGPLRRPESQPGMRVREV